MMPSLVLFDIDGTLLRPCGLGRRSLDRAFLELYGRAGVFDGMRFHGRTDPEILGDGLAAVGALVVAPLALGASAAADTVYSWRTDDGAYAFTDDLQAIPARF